MLGLSKNRPGWKWTAHGKHPCAKDYVSIGHDDALSQALAGWMEKGYEAIEPEAKKDNLARSWRFWVSPPKGDIALVGILRNSCDAIGRPYPLMVLGTGSVSVWHDKWHLLPYACETTWRQMEQLAARSYEDTSRLRDELAIIKGPQSDWQEYTHEMDKFLKTDGTTRHIEKIKKAVTQLLKLGYLLAPIDMVETDRVASILTLWHWIIKAEVSRPPSAVFMGGMNGRIYIAVFTKALSTRDFATLWSVDTGQE